MNGKMEKKKLIQSIQNHLHYTIAKDKYTATKRDIFTAVAYTIRDELFHNWIETQQRYYDEDKKRIYYLSMEFLIGRSLRNNLSNAKRFKEYEEALQELGYTLDEIFELEYDAGLGNGGLGRLAACFLDSMATLSLPGYGYGIRYDYGIFTQKIRDGEQIEVPDNWLRYGNPWEICRSEYRYPIQFYGRVENEQWIETQEVMAVAHDTPIAGYHNSTVNTLRLWQAKSSQGFNLDYFNHGDYIRAVEEIALTENISRVLYPNDNIFEGKELRLKQEYFLVSSTLQDILRRYNKAHPHLDELADKVAIQLNDTHPALAIAEMMHLLVDREEISWEKAWEFTTKIFAYTNHTIMPEAIEKWKVPLLQKVLPRHLQIIERIDRNASLPIIFEEDPKMVNMAHLSIIGSHRVNGVSALHSELLKTQVFKEFYKQTPEKFINITNGMTPRRWLKECNPQLSDLITSKLGTTWVTDLDELQKLKQYKSDPAFQQAFQLAKRRNKEALARLILAKNNLKVDVDSLFDCQIKRIHEYKRQLLNALYIIDLYNRICEGENVVPRTIIFAGKAAPGYFMAKLIIKLINNIGHVVNFDPKSKDLLKVCFIRNYRVTLAEKIIPAADLSQQISTAGTEASGTGNMKLALNGAITIGTLDGANIEILEEVGPDNMFIFGLKADEILTLRSKGYRPLDLYKQNERIRRVIDQIGEGAFSGGDKNTFRPLIDSLLHEGDHYCLLADFDSYIAAQEKVDATYLDPTSWTEKAIINTASMGRFSSDATIKNYASQVWDVAIN
ncbi:MAG: Maltodextrin phosphorylase [Chlamydiales bacterium]|nr:Maltodextrin phosphorylase [Chlamydiales bacterium]MCH9620135.1 Maltodextrin phosphorylase [Chlamydiales bacterium]MCH9623605.1 Maltodextrin phosphorylase [Chlamydiales bacterium]